MHAATLQTLVVAAIVALAALSLGRRAWRMIIAARRRTDAGCGGGCCGS